MRSRLLGGQVSSRLYAVGSDGASDRVSHRVSNRSSKKRSGSFLAAVLIIGILVAIALAVRARLPATAFRPDISAKSAIALDLESSKELLSKDADTRVYPASLTKLMTALILAGHRMPSDLLRCSEAASQQESYNLGMPPGATMTAAAAVDAMLVGSANDAAYMVAEDIGDGSIIVSTLPGGPANPTGAAPGAIIVMENTNPLLGQDGCTAGKTGSTSDAGKCLAALFERDGRRIIAIVMGAPGSDALIDDMRAVVETALKR